MNPVTEFLGYTPAELRAMSENDLLVRIREYVVDGIGWETVMDGIDVGDLVMVVLDAYPKLIGAVGTVIEVEPHPEREEEHLYFRISLDTRTAEAAPSGTVWDEDAKAFATWVTAVEHVTPVPPLTTVEQADAFLEELA